MVSPALERYATRGMEHVTATLGGRWIAAPLVAAKRFFRTPKGLLLIVLAMLIALASLGESIALLGAGPGRRRRRRRR